LDTASSAATLVPAASCTALVSFSPITAGALTGSLIFTDDNLNASPSTTQTLALTGTAIQTTQTITFPQPATPVVYGAGPVTLDATASSGLSVTYTVSSGPATISGSTLTLTGTGTVVVTASQGGDGGHSAATSVSDSIVVTPATLTVTAADATRGYGAANPALTGTYTGAVNGDTFTVSASTSATITSAVGTYAIVPTPTGTDLANYTVVPTNGTLTVAQSTLTVVAADATRVYGTPNPAFAATIIGAVNGDTFAPTFTTLGTRGADAGRYDITPAVTGADIANYAVIPMVGILTVTQATTSLALAASANHASPGSPITLTAMATTASSGTPAGTVVFLANNTAAGSAPLNAQGVATLTIPTLPAGSDTITAVFQETRNFAASTAHLSAPVAIGTPTFLMNSGTLSMTIQSGQAGSATLTLTPEYGYTGTVSFGCNGLPVRSSCVFGPSSVTFDGSGNPVQVSLLMEIGPLGLAKSGSRARLERFTPLGGLPILPAIFFWLPGTGLTLEDRRKKAKRIRSKAAKAMLILALLAISAGVLGLAGCAGMSPYNNNPSPGRQTVTITATGSGNVSQSIAMQVTIQ
jgi:hypothetical protein